MQQMHALSAHQVLTLRTVGKVFQNLQCHAHVFLPVAEELRLLHKLGDVRKHFGLIETEIALRKAPRQVVQWTYYRMRAEADIIP